MRPVSKLVVLFTEVKLGIAPVWGWSLEKLHWEG